MLELYKNGRLKLDILKPVLFVRFLYNYKKFMTELIKSINTSMENLIRCNLARVRKFKCYIMLLPPLSYIYWFIHFKT